MKTISLFLVGFAAITLSVQGQTNRLERPAESRINRNPAEAVAPAPPGVTNAVLVKRIHIGGVIPEVKRKGNPLQLINPFAPARYGTGLQSVSVDPLTGRSAGVSLIRIEF